MGQAGMTLVVLFSVLERTQCAGPMNRVKGGRQKCSIRNWCMFPLDHNIMVG